ncbi:hypothetical protein [Hyphobacterium marinum]|uniref:Uncharacterized protein n=1 Tax=Hyphobacterium marinum TaxID=3116574 RepID=A0ABU7M023_9PROT|nr:hypothetical protein [Hyphobacterium sp. Y6023]MEE2567157.1 hypothetical protein [Hyphobacterium sp. Y6023]
MDQLGDIFRSFWWLLFPLAFFVAQGWSSFLHYKQQKSKIELLKTYAAAGKEPPASLVASLEDGSNHDGHDWTGSGDDSSGHSRGSNAFLVVLFTGLAGVFAVAGYLGILGGVEEELYFVAAVLGVLALAFLVSGMFGGRRKG